MKKWLILLLFGIVFYSSSVSADLSPAICSESGRLGGQSFCESGPECNGDDSFGPGGNPDGIGDVLDRCTWTGTTCIHDPLDGDPDVENNGGLDYLSSYCYDGSDPGCGWLQGSYVVSPRRYCDNSGAPTLRAINTFDTTCGYDGQEYVAFGGPINFINMMYPDISIAGGGSGVFSDGFCLEYCEEVGTNSGDVILHGKCVDYGTPVSGRSTSNCPTTSLDETCEGDTLVRYSCDGDPTYPVDWTGVLAAVDGVNRIRSEFDCYAPGTPSVCDPSCGDSTNTGINTCSLGDGTGYCGISGSGASCETRNVGTGNLDVSEFRIESYYSDCISQGESAGMVNWTQSGEINSFGEYPIQEPSLIQFVFGGTTVLEIYYDRQGWGEEACGDDRDEYLIEDLGTYLCCDDPSDSIVEFTSDADAGDNFDMAGYYCSEGPNTCGNFQREGSEQCDALYAEQRVQIDGTWQVPYPKLLVLGDGCPGGQICDSSCSCGAPITPTCEDGVIEGDEECEPSPLLDLDGQTCDSVATSGVWEGDLDCNSDCTFDVSDCTEVVDDPDPDDGADSYVYGECVCPPSDDCEDGVGEMEVIRVLGASTVTETQECFISEEKIPFASTYSILLAFLILAGFYALKRKK
jgi:hypothetical protein